MWCVKNVQNPMCCLLSQKFSVNLKYCFPIFRGLLIINLIRKIKWTIPITTRTYSQYFVEFLTSLICRASDLLDLSRF